MTTHTISLNSSDAFSAKDLIDQIIVFITNEDDCSARDPQIYDTKNAGLNDPLGPWTSFRCFEFGVTCTCNGGTCTRDFTGVRTHCTPPHTDHASGLNSSYAYLTWLEDDISFFKNLKREDLHALSQHKELGIQGVQRVGAVPLME